MPLPDSCRPDSSGSDWFRCTRGTVGCPKTHDGLVPHCIACQAGEPCHHDPPAVEMTWDEYTKTRAYVASAYAS